MILYADSSFIVACRVPYDTWHEEAVEFFGRHQEDTWLWSPWHRVEVFNTIRQLSRHPDSKRSLSQAEAKALIHRLENDVRCGYFLHMEADWRDVLRMASEISVANAFMRPCPATDLLHVAYAAELAADVFVSFDDEQLGLAAAAGLRALKPGTRDK
jgi:predicted nucleic acid-binding protein